MHLVGTLRTGFLPISRASFCIISTCFLPSSVYSTRNVLDFSVVTYEIIAKENHFLNHHFIYFAKIALSSLLLAETAASFSSITAESTLALRKPDLKHSFRPASVLIYYQKTIFCSSQPDGKRRVRRVGCTSPDKVFLIRPNAADSLSLLPETSCCFFHIEKRA